MRLIDVEQRSSEWLALRKNHITATDCASIMGMGFKTPFQLWKQKLGLEPPDEENEAMRKGKEMEPIALNAFCIETGMLFHPVVTVHENGWMMASIDGLSSCATEGLEIKCGAKAYEQANSGVIPNYYNAQMQHQMYVLGLDWMYYYAFNGEIGIIRKLSRDGSFIAEMLVKEKAFYDALMNPEDCEYSRMQHVIRNDQDWENVSHYWTECNAKLKWWEEETKQVRQKLIELSQGQNCKGFGVKVTQVLRKGNVDYSKIPELKGVNLELFRKNIITTWKIGECDG